MTTKKVARKKKTTRTKAANAKSKKEGPTSLLDAAAAVLAKSSDPMSCPQMVDAVLKNGAWKTHGKTPAATLSSAIHREILEKGKEARFAKSERGLFRLTATRGAGRGRAG